MNPDRNVYAPPAAEQMTAPANAAPIAPYRLYSPQHVAIATFIGSPLAGGWVLASNYGALGDKAGQKKALLGGFAVTVALLLISALLPPNFPSVVLSIAYVYASLHWAQTTQGAAFRRHIGSGALAYSGWRAAGVGVIGLLLMLVLLAVMFLIIPENI